MTQSAADWLAERCAAPVAAIYLNEDGPGQVRRGLHAPGPGGPGSALLSLLPGRLWWQGPAAWTSSRGPSMRVVPFRVGTEGGVVVVGPFGPAARDRLARSIDAQVRSLVAPLVVGLQRFPSRAGRTELLAAVAHQFGASLDGSPDPLLFVLRERLEARRVAWEDGGLVIEGAAQRAPSAVTAAEWWLPLITTGAADEPGRRVELVLLGLADLLDARHPSTAGRSLAAADLALRLGARIGMDPVELAGLEEAANLHRIGTALVEASSSRLGPVGAAVLEGAGRPAEVCEILRRLPERWDGDGPGGLSSRDIPAGARVLAVVGAWLDMLALGGEPELVSRRAARALVEEVGTAFDPRVVGALLEETDAAAM